MKVKLTRHEVTRNFVKVYACGYCELQNIYSSGEAFGYNAGIYGWNWDAYRLPGAICITTGYRGMVGRNLPLAAEKILRNVERQLPKYKAGKDYEKKQAYLKRARKAFEKALQDDRF